MKLKMKVLAVAMLAAASSANAAIDLGTTGNSSLFLTIVDTTNNVSFLADLGKNFSDFNVASTNFANSGVTASGTSFSWDMTTADWAPIYSTFVSAASASSNWKWAVSATDGAGTGAGSRSFISSYSSLGSSITTTQTIQAIGNFDSYLGPNTTSFTVATNMNTVANGAGVSNSGQGYAIGVGYKADGRFGGSSGGVIALQSIGTDAGVAQYVIAGSSLTPSTRTLFDNGAKFNLASNGLLTYSTAPVTPVPEADTWMLMLLGLGLMGYKSTRKAI